MPIDDFVEMEKSNMRILKQENQSTIRSWMSPGIYAIIVPGVNRYGEENPVKIFQIDQKFGENAIEVSK